MRANTLGSSSRFPFLLSPVAKDYLWGGERLKGLFDDGDAFDIIAEAWVCSTHDHGVSMVASGPCKGQLLTDVLKRHPDYLGSHPSCDAGQLPVLIKFIDAKQNLSVQVHPDDDYAKEHESGQLGKIEMWYVLEAKEGARIVYGFNGDYEKEDIGQALDEGRIEECLNYVPVKAGDVFLVKPGTVHAIGEGILIAEIQESSDLSYRLYDYGRLDREGHARPLHIDKSLDVLNYKTTPMPKLPMRIFSYVPGAATELLARCEYFQVERMLLYTEDMPAGVSYQTTRYSFEVLLCYSGQAVIENPTTHESIRLDMGRAIFAPASSPALRLTGHASLLRVRF